MTKTSALKKSLCNSERMNTGVIYRVSCRERIQKSVFFFAPIIQHMKLFKKALQDSTEGINYKIINNLRYADDTVLLANNTERVQKIIDRLAISSEHYVKKLASS